jgi:acyl-CoA synthetase (AMP-forming)/AMP-acid ligase II
MTLADLIAPGSCPARLHFPDEGVSVDYGDLWKSGEAIGCLRADFDGKPVAIALANTRACASVLVGAIAAGQPILSIPLPPRGADIEWYSRFVQQICGSSGAETMLVDASLLSVLPSMEGVRLMSFDAALALRRPSLVEPDAFVLTQFTSGSTADPKGVVLPQAKIVANLVALLEWLQPVPGDGACSWLPLSHDMGLIGMFLGSLAAAGDRWTRGTDLVLMTPQGFLRDPGRWLSACDEFGATMTAAPNYGFDMACRKRKRVHDLSRLRVCIAGGEPVRAASLERFASAFEDAGFNPMAFSPAYGMAEAVLAVAGTRTDDHWRSCELTPAEPSVLGAAIDTHQIVSSGAPLDGYELRIEGADVGEILVRGPSLADAYADGTVLADHDGWFHTRDLGALRDGELYVIGRTDDVLFVAGRNVYAQEIEAHASEVSGVRDGRVVAVPEDGGVTLVAECEPRISDEASTRRLAEELRQRVLARLGVAPRRVLLAPRGALPMTSSGKIRRKPLVATLQASQLEILTGSLER